jgi:hypothetical protein
LNAFLYRTGEQSNKWVDWPSASEYWSSYKDV